MSKSIFSIYFMFLCGEKVFFFNISRSYMLTLRMKEYSFLTLSLWKSSCTKATSANCLFFDYCYDMIKCMCFFFHSDRLFKGEVGYILFIEVGPSTLRLFLRWHFLWIDTFSLVFSVSDKFNFSNVFLVQNILRLQERQRENASPSRATEKGKHFKS